MYEEVLLANPPTNNFPPIPTPPATCRAPVVVDVATVVPIIVEVVAVKIPLILAPPLTANLAPRRLVELLV